MLSMGGVDGENRTFTAPTTADPWTYGIGILDMTELQWTNSYNPDAPAYDSPTVVKEWYKAGHLQNINWDNKDLEAIFMDTGGDTPTPPASPVANTPTSRAVIVGGAVGGVLGVAAIGMMSFLFMKRRRARAETPDSANHPALKYGDQEEVAEYKPDPWPKDQGPQYYSPDSIMSASTHSPSIPQYPAEIHEIHGRWRGELSGHQDGIVPMPARELPGTAPRLGELMDANMEWAHELPVPLEEPRTELPDRKYSQ
jgi:hypothetical protein